MSPTTDDLIDACGPALAGLMRHKDEFREGWKAIPAADGLIAFGDTPYAALEAFLASQQRRA